MTPNNTEKMKTTPQSPERPKSELDALRMKVLPTKQTQGKLDALSSSLEQQVSVEKLIQSFDVSREAPDETDKDLEKKGIYFVSGVHDVLVKFMQAGISADSFQASAIETTVKKIEVIQVVTGLPAAELAAWNKLLEAVRADSSFVTPEWDRIRANASEAYTNAKQAIDAKDESEEPKNGLWEKTKAWVKDDKNKWLVGGLVVAGAGVTIWALSSLFKHDDTAGTEKGWFGKLFDKIKVPLAVGTICTMLYLSREHIIGFFKDKFGINLFPDQLKQGLDLIMAGKFLEGISTWFTGGENPEYKAAREKLAAQIGVKEATLAFVGKSKVKEIGDAANPDDIWNHFWTPMLSGIPWVGSGLTPNDEVKAELAKVHQHFRTQVDYTKDTTVGDMTINDYALALSKGEIAAKPTDQTSTAPDGTTPDTTAATSPDAIKPADAATIEAIQDTEIKAAASEVEKNVLAPIRLELNINTFNKALSYAEAQGFDTTYARELYQNIGTAEAAYQEALKKPDLTAEEYKEALQTLVASYHALGEELGHLKSEKTDTIPEFLTNYTTKMMGILNDGWKLIPLRAYPILQSIKIASKGIGKVGKGITAIPKAVGGMNKETRVWGNEMYDAKTHTEDPDIKKRDDLAKKTEPLTDVEKKQVAIGDAKEKYYQTLKQNAKNPDAIKKALLAVRETEAEHAAAKLNDPDRLKSAKLDAGALDPKDIDRSTGANKADVQKREMLKKIDHDLGLFDDVNKKYHELDKLYDQRLNELVKDIDGVAKDKNVSETNKKLKLDNLKTTLAEVTTKRFGAGSTFIDNLGFMAKKHRDVIEANPKYQVKIKDWMSQLTERKSNIVKELVGGGQKLTQHMDNLKIPMVKGNILFLGIGLAQALASSHQHDSNFGMEAAQVAADMIPGVGVASDFWTVATGREAVTGREVGWTDRGIRLGTGVLGVVTLGFGSTIAKGILKGGAKLTKGALNLADKAGDTSKAIKYLSKADPDAIKALDKVAALGTKVLVKGGVMMVPITVGTTALSLAPMGYEMLAEFRTKKIPDDLLKYAGDSVKNLVS